MLLRALPCSLLAASLGAAAAGAQVAPVSVPAAQSGAWPFSWRQHDVTRPPAPVVVPAPQASVAPPSDAVVLFDGRDLSAFVTGAQGEAPRWKVENGYAEVVPRTGSIRSRDSFGDVQLHVEWAAPTETGVGQNHSNSGVILMGRYEIQILDSYNFTDTYVDGSAGSIYGQYPPLANPLLPTGQFNVMDIFFRRPRFRPDGSLAEPARATVLINGVLVQSNEILYGPTAPEPPYQYVPHEDALPFTLQDHGQALRFRNIWVRRIAERPEPGPGYVPRAASLTPEQLDRFVGVYVSQPGPGAAGQGAAPAPAYTITRQGEQLLVRLANGNTVRAIATSPTRLWLPGRARNLTFTFDGSGRATQVVVEGTGATSTVVPRAAAGGR